MAIDNGWMDDLEPIDNNYIDIVTHSETFSTESATNSLENNENAEAEALDFLSDLDEKWLSTYDDYMEDMQKSNQPMSMVGYANWIKNNPEYQNDMKEKQLEGGRPKVLMKKNPDVKSSMLENPNINSKTHSDAFFKSFVFTALICGMLMGLYMSLF